MRPPTPVLAVVALGALAALAACERGRIGADDAGPGDGDGGGPIDGDGGAIDAGAPDANYPPPLIEGLGTLAGTEVGVAVDGERDVARFENPVNLLAHDGALLVADQDSHRIRRVELDGTTTTLVYRAFDFERPFGMALDGDLLYVQTDHDDDLTSRGALWRFDLTTLEKTLLLAEVEPLSGRYRGLGVLSDGTLVLGNYLRHTLYRFDPATGQKTLLAGADGIPGHVDSTIGSEARFDQPYDLLVLPGDLIVVADHSNHRIRLVTAEGVVSTFAGTGEVGSLDGPRESATFHFPQALALDDAGNLYVSEPGSHLIRRIDAAGEVTTIAGDGTAGWRDSEAPLGGALYGVEGLAYLGGYLYVADGNRGDGARFHRIRRVTLP